MLHVGSRYLEFQEQTSSPVHVTSSTTQCLHHAFVEQNTQLFCSTKGYDTQQEPTFTSNQQL
jgi:hypothetical protein